MARKTNEITLEPQRKEACNGTKDIAQGCKNIERADDLDTVVQIKREGWRATAAKAGRRQRGYANRAIKECAQVSLDDATFPDASFRNQGQDKYEKHD